MDQTEILKELTAAAERFVQKAPKQQRLEADRAALLDAITRAQLLLSTIQRNRKAGREQRPVSMEDVTEAASLLRSLPGQRAMAPEQRQAVQRKRLTRRRTPGPV
jgi:hypothetical protein